MLKIISDRNSIEKELNKIVGRVEYLYNKKNIEVVKRIINNVKKNGDKAIRKYTQQFDKVTIKDFKVNKLEIGNARKYVDDEFIRVINKTKENITKFYQKQKNYLTEVKNKVVYERLIPIEKLGVYIPGGKAAYPSTVLHTCIPAKVAGVKNIIVTTPPNEQKTINYYTLVTLAELNIKEIYKIGGAQAIAALAYGTETIPKVDKIIGPGNIYVNLAKKLLYGEVGIDGLYAATEIVILSDEEANPKFIAYDLLAQVEHSEDTLGIIITTSKKVAKEVIEKINSIDTVRKEICNKALKKFGRIFVVNNIDYAIELINRIAPEHLQIFVKDYKSVLYKITNVGAISIGNYSPAAITDYLAGPSHVLPTGGSARFSSYLNLENFYRRVNIINYNKHKLSKVKNIINKLAEVEGLYAHKESINVRT